MSNEIKPVCVLQGPIASRSGYGDDCRARAIALIDSNKFDVKIIPMRWGVCPNTMLDDENAYMVKEIKSRIATNINAQPELFVQVSIPNEFIERQSWPVRMLLRPKHSIAILTSVLRIFRNVTSTN